MRHTPWLAVLLVMVGILCGLQTVVIGCTGVMLRGQDGTIVVARTNEWGRFDMQSEILVYPREYGVRCQSPCGGCPGMEYTTRYGVVGVNAMGYADIVDGMNECGLVAGFFYLPGFAEYEPYDSARRDWTMSSIDFVLYVLSQYATVGEVRTALQANPPDFYIAPIPVDILGEFAPLHFRVADATGNAIVIEFVEGGQLRIYEPLNGVITNSPTYDWHLTNLRNYIELQKKNRDGVLIDGRLFPPLGGGSGMLGLPGDSTPPSRFVQAVWFTETARTTAGGLDTVNEAFRILDHFNFAAYGAEGSLQTESDQLPSATQWTVAADASHRAYYYHTAWNRRVRMIDLGKIDFSPGDVQSRPMDVPREQDVQEIDFGSG